MGSQDRVLVIIPAYNEEACIRRTVTDLLECNTGLDVIVVDDGSTDATAEQARDAGALVLQLPVNLGIGGAMQAGYLHASLNSYDFAMQFDGDGQHPAVEVPRLIETIRSGGADMVIGSRFLENNGFQSTVMRRFGIQFFSWLLRCLTGRRFTDPTSGFRIVSRPAIDLFARRYPEDYPEPEAILVCCRNGLHVAEVPVTMRARQTGNSSIRSFRVIYYMVKVTLALLMCRLRASQRHLARC